MLRVVPWERQDAPIPERTLWLTAAIASGVMGVAMLLFVGVGVALPEVIGTPLAIFYAIAMLSFARSLIASRQYWDFALAFYVTALPWLIAAAAVGGPS
jgi:hypothetical protein